MKTERCWLAIGLAVIGLAVVPPAQAQEPVGEIGTTAEGPSSGYGIQLMLGGGYSDFTGSTARGLTSGAGTWGLRTVIGSRLPVGFEAAYVGSAQDLDSDGLDPSAYLLGTGFEGSLRLAIPTVMERWVITPFATAGVGWNYFSLESTESSASIGDDDGAFTLPLAAGFDATYGGFVMNVRATYRPSFGDDLVEGADMSTWGISGSLGVEF
jgi:hypothetical protein